MTRFKTLLKNILSSPSENTQISVLEKIKKIKAMVRLTSLHYLKDNGEYIKILFTDKSFLMLIPSDEEIYYAPKLLGKASEITDDMIGSNKIIVYRGKKYELGNKNDYQLVIELLVGTPTDIEGEVRFSDYFPVIGPKEFLSLGWLVRTGERADIHCQIINTKDIEIINPKK